MRIFGGKWYVSTNAANARDGVIDRGGIHGPDHASRDTCPGGSANSGSSARCTVGSCKYFMIGTSSSATVLRPICTSRKSSAWARVAQAADSLNQRVRHAESVLPVPARAGLRHRDNEVQSWDHWRCTVARVIERTSFASLASIASGGI